MFYDVFSFPAGVYAATLNLIASIPGLSILILPIATQSRALSQDLLDSEIFYSCYSRETVKTILQYQYT